MPPMPCGFTGTEDTRPRLPPAPATNDLWNPNTVIYSNSAVPVTAVHTSVLDRNQLLPFYWFLRCNFPAFPVVTMNKTFLLLESIFSS